MDYAFIIGELEMKKALSNFFQGLKKYHYHRLLSAVLFAVFLIVGVVTDNFVFGRSHSLLAAIFSVMVSSLSILTFANSILIERSLRKKEQIKLIKALHKRFFEELRSEVVHLIKEDRIHERLLPRSSQ